MHRRGSRRRRAAILGLSIVVFLLELVLLFRPQTPPSVGTDTASPSTSEQAIIVGIPGGVVVNSSPTPTPAPSTESMPTVTPPVTPAPTMSASPAPVAQAPSVTPSPLVTPPLPAAVPTAAASTVAVAGSPHEVVAAFYSYVESGSFDAASALWSSTMHGRYPRDTNLDGRFAQTEAVEWLQLETVALSPTSAQVQANFVEIYDTGASRTFVGYWDLVLVGGQWLLDAPHY